MIILISSILTAALSGQEKKDNLPCDEPDSLIPSDAGVFIKVAKISKAIEFINSRKNYYNFSDLLLKKAKWIKTLKDRTKIDLLNTKSLKEIGIDADKALYLASLGYDKNESDTIIFIPVIDKKNFPFSFIKFLKRINDDKASPDLNPAISAYKGTRVFQIPNKIFFTVIDDYFVLTSSGSILTNIIDLKTDGCSSALSTNHAYRDYRTGIESSSESNILSIFIKKEFLENKVKAADTNDAGENIRAKRSDLNFIKYVSLGLENDSDDLSFKANISINKDDPAGAVILNALTTGLFENALFADNPTGYHFLSIDMNMINEYFTSMADKNDGAYRKYSGILDTDNNLNFLKDTPLPCSKSFMNIILKKPEKSGEMDNFIVYIPMKECGNIKRTLKNLKNQVQKTHPEEGAFGEERINGNYSFWFKNSGNSKTYFLEFQGDFYAGNNPDFIKTVLNSGDKNSAGTNNDFIKRIDKNTFLVSYTQFDDDSFLKAILMMLVYNNSSELYQLISKTGNIFLTGKKAGDALIFNLRLKMLNNK